MSKEEIIDIVDENDKVIGQLPKRVVHSKKGILHREIGVVVVDNNNRVLLQQRSFKKKLFPGEWTVSAVGHVPAGLTPEEAAHKELSEELGIDTQLTFIEKRKYISGDHISFGYLFKGTVNEDVKIIINKQEVEQAKFVSKKEILKMEDEGLIDYHTRETLSKFYLYEYHQRNAGGIYPAG
ncbi:MAG: NUDIX hydrolase [Candidatus Dojkabacteria bacterium]|jgi:isopentenyl-diphosphate delta-isomerase